MDAKTLRAAFPHTIPVLTGYLFLGFAYGLLMRNAGYPVWLAVLCSLAVYAGAAQYAAVPMLGVFDPAGTFLLTLMLNARHVFYGLSMLERYREAGKSKPYLIFSLTDETYSILVSTSPPSGVEARRFWLAVSALNQMYWVVASAAGALLGAALPFDTRGVDFVMTALFVTMFTEQWLQTREHRPALIGLGAAVLCLVLFQTNFIVPAMAMIVVLLLVGQNHMEGGAEA